MLVQPFTLGVAKLSRKDENGVRSWLVLLLLVETIVMYPLRFTYFLDCPKRSKLKSQAGQRKDEPAQSLPSRERRTL